MSHEEPSQEHRQRRRRHKRRSSGPVQFMEPGSNHNVSQPLLVITDSCLALTFVLVALGFGGRAAIGQLFLVAGALATTTCWLLHQLTAKERKYVWTGSEWLWALGITVAAIQIIPLSQLWLVWLSPQLTEILPLMMTSGASEIIPGGWNQLSLAPAETASGLATFAAYGLLFLVMVQRIQTLADVEKILCCAAFASVAMGAFALVQYKFSNDKFYWMVDHPFMTTSHCALGCFTNRNHLAQFLALGVGPLIWWILGRFHDQEQSGDNALPPPVHTVAVFVLLAGLATTSLASLLCYSRGGLLSLTIATVVSLGLLCRMGLASAKLVLGLSVAGAVIGVVFFVNGMETLEKRLEGTIANSSDEGRYVIWQANIDVARDFPWLGTGIGTHADAYHLHFDQANEDSLEYTHAECGYLQVASESGMCGLAVAIAFILFSLRHTLRALWHHDLRYRSVAAAVLASLLANICHAAFDFFWYTPSCMFLLAAQLAAVTRISRSMVTASESEELVAPGFRLPRLITLASGCGLAAAGVWMLGHKIPAALAEPDRMHYLCLAYQNTTEEDEDAESLDERGDYLIRAAKLDPSDSKLQEFAGMEYLRRFDALQETSENPLSFGQIRDVVKGSNFESLAKMKAWMQLAVGKNVKLLQLATKSYRRAVHASPLRVYSYVKLAELGFLELTTDEQEMTVLKQALRLRPYDPQVLFQVGRNVMLSGDIEGALEYWRDAFSRSRRIQSIIVTQLAPQVEPEFFLENLKPDWEAQGMVARAYQELDRVDAARPIWIRHINEGMQRLKTPLPELRLEYAILSMHDACQALEDTDLAIRILNRGLKRVPQSYLIRNRLAWELYSAKRFREAAEHLKWCASRRPNDKGLQMAAAQATKESLKASNDSERRS